MKRSRWLLLGIAVGACLMLLLAAFIGPAHAADLTPQQARDVLAVAYGQYHGPRTLLDDPPPIHVVSQDELQRRNECSGESCTKIRGLYDDESGEIYLDSALDFSTVYATTVLLHEFVHHFQAKTRGRMVDLRTKLSKYDFCVEFVSREHEAYRIQWTVLLKAGEYLLAQAVRRTAGQFGCGTPQ